MTCPAATAKTWRLERAEPPSDPKTPAMKSRFASCSDMMDVDKLTEWAARYAEMGWIGRTPGVPPLPARPA